MIKIRLDQRDQQLNGNQTVAQNDEHGGHAHNDGAQHELAKTLTGIGQGVDDHAAGAGCGVVGELHQTGGHLQALVKHGRWRQYRTAAHTGARDLEGIDDGGNPLGCLDQDHGKKRKRHDLEQGPDHDLGKFRFFEGELNG
jgi:hypothetical protein